MLEPSPWGRALTLSERDLLYSDPSSTSTPVADSDADAAAERVAQWRKIGALDDEERFAERLAQEGLDLERFTRLINDAPPAADNPEWADFLEAAYAHDASTDDGESAEQGMSIEAIAGQDDVVLVDIVRPLLDHGWRQLQQGLAEIDSGDSDLDLPTYAGLWARPLPGQLLKMVTKTLILELFVHKYEGSLKGDTPEARFDAFIERYRSGAGARELWTRYSVLARAVAERMQQWLEVGLEFARRLVADLPVLGSSFAAEGVLGELVALEPGLGDRHAAGRTVVRLEFSSGTKLIYKPRSLALDVVFQDLVSWLGDQGVEPKLRSLLVVSRKDYGWVEFVEHETCASEAEVHRFYQRQGVHLALLYALEATDFHHENLIANGEYPVLIDLETLFQPHLMHPELSREDRNPVAPTILRSGLLPRHAWGEQGVEGIDLSGLSASNDQLTPMRKLTRIGTDEMAFVDGMTRMPVGNHMPTLRGEGVAVWSYRHVILDSFVATYRQIARLRQHFLEPGGWLDRFAGLQTRVVVRPTGLYVRLLNLAYHPDHLQDALQRDRLYEKLWLDAERFNYVSQVIPFERRDMWRGDVPHFTSRTDSPDLYSSSGERVVDALPETGLDLARERIEAMDEDDLERQLALARLSLVGTRSLDILRGPDTRRSVASAAVTPLAAQDFSALAAKVGDRLEVLAFRHDEWLSWFHLRSTAEGRQLLEPVGPDLYAGLGGIALFYGVLGVHGPAASRDRFTELAGAALATGRERFDGDKAFRSRIGGHSGLGGWIYVLTYLAVLWQSDELLDQAESARDLIPPLIDADDGLDIIGGAAGCIGALLALHKHRPSAATLEVAVACGQHLASRAETQKHGIAWRLPAIAELPLTGFAHGTAGIAWALARLAATRGRDDFAEAARGGLAYERGLFSEARDNWPDLRIDRRDDGGDWGYFHAWCHGAPGIGLSRLDLLKHFDGDLWSQPEREGEIKAAVRSTLAGGFGESHCLCHGDLGNLELVQRAAEHFGDDELRQAERAMAGRIVGGMEQIGYRCGIRSRVDLPGLLTGLAGIGYGLLRLAGRSKIPSVLLFETPD